MLTFAPLEFEREGERRGEVVGIGGDWRPPKRRRRAGAGAIECPLSPAVITAGP